MAAAEAARRRRQGACGHENSADCIDKRISEIHIASVPADLPLLSHLLRVFYPGAGKIRFF
jgi:hypothetical protein